MGWSFRKSKSVGPLRFTLTHRGLSTSLGLGAFRIGRTASRGGYFSAGIPGTGLRYRANLGRSDDGLVGEAEFDPNAYDPYAPYRKYQALTPMTLVDAWAIHRMCEGLGTANVLNALTLVGLAAPVVLGFWLPFAWIAAGLLVVTLLVTTAWQRTVLARIGRHGRLANEHYERQRALMPPPLPEEYLAWYGTTFAQPEYEPASLVQVDTAGLGCARALCCGLGIVIWLAAWLGLLAIVSGQLVLGAATGDAQIVLGVLAGGCCLGIAAGAIVAGESAM